MTPREADPTGAFSRGGEAGLETDEGEALDRSPRDGDRSGQPGSQPESVTPGVDTTERMTITSGTAATSEVADRDAQGDAEGHGQGTPRR
jgi:hypothetical protein